MAKNRSVVVCILNIEMGVPHNPMRYEKLWLSMYALKRPIQTRGDQHLMITSAQRGKELPHIISGTIARFTKIDVSLPWFDEENLNQADERGLSKIVIPENLNPNLMTAYYAFDTIQHKCYVEVYGYQVSISIAQYHKMLSKLVEDSKILSEFGNIGVSIIQTEEAIEEMENLDFIKELKIEYRQPNTDDHDKFDKIFADKMQKANARTAILDLKSGQDKGISFDKWIRNLANSALKHGSILVSGRDSSGNLVKLSSENHPELHNEKYNPDLITHKQAFNKIVKKIIDFGNQDV